MNFGQALEIVKRGGRVRRSGWHPALAWIELQVPDAENGLRGPILYVGDREGLTSIWHVGHGDLLGEDWEVV
jgi:hypothetical protein